MADNYSVKYVFETIDNMSRNLKDIKRNLKGVNNEFGTGDKKANKFNMAMKSTARTMKNVASRLRFVSLALTGVATAGIYAFSKIESGLIDVQNLIETEDLPKFNNELIALQKNAIRAGFGIEDASKALFDTVSALGMGTQASNTFKIAQKLAIGGASELKVAVDGLTSIINAYGRESTKATDVANALFSAQVKGKCFAKGTSILMYNGTSKKVEDIVVGDQIMGDDNTPRNIMALGTGKEMMYKINLRDGSSYTVNESHILSLKRNYMNGKNEVVNLTVKEYLNKSNDFKNRYFAYKVGIELKEKPVDIEPYLLGLWLSNGSSGSPRITTLDNEVVEYMKNQANKNGWNFSKYEIKNNKANTYSLTNNRGRSKGCFWSLLKKYNLDNNKHIPKEYLINSKKIRLELLAGLIDGDGYLSTVNKCNNYEYSTVREDLKNDFIWLARSCGFYASCYKKHLNNKIYYKIYISGDLHNIPCKVKRRICPKYEGIRCDVLTQKFTVEAVGEDKFYGFEINGNKLFVLNDFSVTHNTTVSELSSEVGKVAPIAKAAGVGFKELLSTMAALTLGGLKTDMASTALRAALTSLVKPGKQSRAILDHLGIAYGRNRIKAVGLKNVLWQIVEANKKNGELLDLAIPNIRASTGLFALNAEKIRIADDAMKKINKDIKNGTGLQEAYNRKNKSSELLLRRIRGTLSLLSAELGEALSPSLKFVAEKLGVAYKWFSKLDAKTKKYTAILTVLGIVSVPLATAIGLVASALAAIGTTGLIVMGVIGSLTAIVSGAIIYWERLVGILDKVANKFNSISWIFRLAGFYLPEIQTQSYTPRASNINKYSADINLNMNAPKGTIKNYTSATKGSGMNLGINMSEAGI